jgi:hypothetical protein
MGFLAYPQKDLLRGQRGLNMVDYLLNIGPEFTLKSQNVYFFRKTLRRRRGFTRLSTEDWSAASWVGGHEFLDAYGNSRLLVARGNGDILEYQSAAASAAVKAGLATDQETYFATLFGATFAANGDDPLQRIDATENPLVECTSRDAGVPAKPSLVVTAGTATGQTGDYAFVATSVIEDGSGTKLLESDWSDLFLLTLADTKQSGTVTPGEVDARVTHHYIYRTDEGGAQPKYMTKVTAAAPVFTNVNVADSALGAFAPMRSKNAVPPTAPEKVIACGARLVLLKGNVAYFSPSGLNAYDLEAFPTQLTAPGPGPFKGGVAIPNPGGTPGTNSLFLGQENSCCVLFNCDPTRPLTNLSPEIGLMNSRAIATRGKGVFFVDRRRGVMWWPGEGEEIYGVGDLINSILTGEGYQSVSVNDGDANVTLSVWRDMLLLTVRDDNTKTGANKVYQMDLLAFERDLLKYGPGGAAVWAGPWTGPGFSRFIPMADRTLVLLDNQNRYLLKWDTTTFKDYIAGAEAAVLPAIRLGPSMRETLEENKRIHQFYLYAYANQNSSLRIIGEEGRIDLSDIALVPINYADLPVIDIPLVDIAVINEAWKSQAQVDWSVVAVWFIFEVSTADEDNDWIFVGVKALITRTKITVVYV